MANNDLLKAHMSPQKPSRNPYDNQGSFGTPILHGSNENTFNNKKDSEVKFD